MEESTTGLSEVATMTSVSEKEELSKSLSRRDFLKVGGFGTLGMFAPNINLETPQDGLHDKDLDNTNLPAEEIPGEIDLKLSDDEKLKWETLWKETEATIEFGNLEGFINTACVMLNVTRARDLKGEDFTNFVMDFYHRGIKVAGKNLYVISEIDNYLMPGFTQVRDSALNGEIATSAYSLWATSFLQTLTFSYLYTADDGSLDSEGLYATGANELAYTQFVFPEVIEDLFGKPGMGTGDRQDYYVDVTKADEGFTDRVYDLDSREPTKNLVQRPLKKLDDLWFGDIVFRDKTTGYKMGHPMAVVWSQRDQFGNLVEGDAIGLSDTNIEGKMIAGVYKVNTQQTLDIVAGKDYKKGILRTSFADDDMFINRSRLSTILTLDQIPAELQSGRPEMSPEFEQVSSLSGEWKKFSDDDKRVGAIRRIIDLVGLKIKGQDGNIKTGPVWEDKFGNNYWRCNLYATRFLQALGIKDVGHWFINNVPTKNTGEEFSNADMHAWMNKKGREFNWINVTHLPKKTRDEMLVQGYVFYSLTQGHSSVVVPAQNRDGKLVPGMTQAGYDHPLRLINYGSKYFRPRSQPELADNPNMGILWAHLLPNVKEPKTPVRSPLFGQNIPETYDTENNNKLGWLTSVNELKKLAGEEIKATGLRGLLEEFFDPKVEKIPTGNNIFKFSFDVVQAIQQYQLPLGQSSDKDPELFVAYLKDVLIKKGYKKVLESKHASAVFNNVLANFVSHESSQEQNREFQPVKCFGLSEILALGRGVVDFAPSQAGGLSAPNAQEVANFMIGHKSSTGVPYVDATSTAVHFQNDLPEDFSNIKEGDSFFLSYPGKSEGHVGVIITNPFIDKNGRTVVAVADSNRVMQINNGEGKVVADGMPRIRIMDYEEFKNQYFLGRDLTRNAKMVVLRPNTKK